MNKRSRCSAGDLLRRKKMSDRIRPIRMELLVAKFEKIENFEQPRLLEELGQNPELAQALLFLQWVSQPRNFRGGLSRFTADFISECAEEIGTRHMRDFGKVSHYTFEQSNAILGDLPKRQKETLVGRSDPDDDPRWLFFDGVSLTRAAERDKALRDYRKDIEKLLGRFTRSFIHEFCINEAKQNLADYFKQVCETPHVGLLPCDRSEGVGAPFYFEKVAEALLAFIDARAQQLRARLADTKITQEIRRWLAKSRRMQKSLEVSGNSRFGKTETLTVEAIADPGRYRLVNTPPSNSLSDLLRAVAKSLGLEVGPRTSVCDLRELIYRVLRFTHLGLILDECQRLLPQNYSRNSAPARLNWVRGSIMDQGSPVVFVCTPQSYLPAKDRFAKTTGYAMEQFDERIYRVELPEQLEEADLLAVGRIHFEDLEEKHLRYVLAKVLAAERNFVSDMEKIATLAKDNAREHGRKKPTLADIDAAMAIVLPRAEPASPAQKAAPKPPVRRPCKRVAEPLPMPRRGFGLETTLSRDRLERPAEVPA